MQNRSRALIRGYSNDYDGIPCLCLEVSRDLIESWLQRAKLAKQLRKKDTALSSLDYQECSGIFFDLDCLDKLPLNASPGTEGVLREAVDTALDVMEVEDIVVLAPDSPLYAALGAAIEQEIIDGGIRIRTEMDQLEVTEHGVVRCAHVKNTGARIETVPLPDKALLRTLML